MNSENNRELLCIAGQEKNYALELKWIAEIYADVHISSFPCLPPHYLGMYNYKGRIIPVIRLEEGEGRVLVIVRCEESLFAMAAAREPFIISGDALEEIESLHPESLAGLWLEKTLYQMEGALVSLLDIPGTVEKILSENENV